MPKLSTDSSITMQKNPNSPASEAYRSLRFNIDCSVFGREAKTITVTSSGRGEGKTTTAINLAVAYAQTGKKVVLVDADLRNPSIHLTFREDNAKGLTNYLANQSTWNEIVRESYIENLSFVTSGPAPQNPSGLLASHQMDVLLAELSATYDMVIVDTTSILTVTDAKIMATKCDGTLLIVKSGKVKRGIAKKVKEELHLANVNLIGVVMNEVKSDHASSYL
ncbi:CpsD/CapB family tyrosine-protein kinase [Paenibacillus sp. CGMCC 1.16610]|uniref:non-specific protein-tyrosine kinase n=1 Tax=Paenibacillus anseongense TaxID=2682845 RepID=A0ABW9U319_9BACL|nr:MULTISPECIES: CpsD/CapB family tyrosine-protein kinase [Paenibacillus]MBA2943319.1 CpsD/CapB family tyrosine-protein kinase [Paenibacillus sp. CGMCC 1.16610]MVQ33817.1 polysaccharide biosynthesis tyrosine autokinase [Paenibacillus anseongense]